MLFSLVHVPSSTQVYKTVLEACNQDDLQLPILEVRDVKKVSLVLVTGDRGLCGSYNSQVIKAATKRVNKLREQGIDVSSCGDRGSCQYFMFNLWTWFFVIEMQVQFVLVGRKGEQWFAKRDVPIAGRFILGNSPAPSVGSGLANLLIAQFLTKEVDAAEIIYTRFNNLISCEPSIRTLLPLSLSGIESEDDEVFKVSTKDGKMILQKQSVPENKPVMPDYIFEDEPTEILNTMLTLYFSATLMRCMQESVASELASRMTAMQSASNNAKKITSVLSQVYNRARQSSVTQEMLEIVAGAATQE